MRNNIIELEEMNHEKEILRAQAREEGKPENIIEKMEGEKEI